MNIHEALMIIYPAQGETTVISSLLSGNADPVKSPDVIDKSLSELEKELEKTLEAQKNCQSDWAYWGYEGTISYLKSAIYILKAADIVGPNNLFDATKPNTNGVVMDVQSNIEKFGRIIYEEALKMREIAKEIAQREMKKAGLTPPQKGE